MGRSPDGDLGGGRMSKRKPKRLDAAESLKCWADVLKAGAASVDQQRELGIKLERVADRESLRDVFGSPSVKLPHGRPPTTDAKCWEFLELLLDGKSQAEAARIVGRARPQPPGAFRHGC